MNNPRIVIVVLVLIAILFVIGISYGLFRDDKENKNDDASITKAVKEAPALIKSLGAMLGSRGAKLTAKDFVDSKYADEPVKLTFSNTIFLPVQIKASDEKYRKAVFRLTGAGRVVIEYQNDCPPEEVTDEDARKKLTKQKVEMSGPGKPLGKDRSCQDDDESCGKLTIFKCGGTLTFICRDTACQVELLQQSDK